MQKLIVLLVFGLIGCNGGFTRFDESCQVAKGSWEVAIAQCGVCAPHCAQKLLPGISCSSPAMKRLDMIPASEVAQGIVGDAYRPFLEACYSCAPHCVPVEEE